VTNHDVTGRSSGTEYHYRVRGVNADGLLSGNSNIVMVVTVGSPPTALIATDVTDTSFIGNWSQVIGSSSYELDVALDSGFTFLAVSNRSVLTTSETVAGLSPGTTHYYRVRAVNQGGVSENSNRISVMTAPEPPVASTPSAVTAFSFTANWNTVPGGTSYRLYIARDSAFTVESDSITVPGSSHGVSGRTAATAYYYRVRALNLENRIGRTSNIVTVVTSPAAPTALAATSVGTTSFTANWNTVNGATSYRLDVATDSGFTAFVPGHTDLTVNAISRSVTGLSQAARYYYRVRALGVGGVSTNSNSISVATITDPPIVSAPTGITSTQFSANWLAVTGAASYRLDVANDTGFTSFVSPAYNNRSVIATSEAVTGLSSAVTYFYRVRAVSTGGTSGNSNRATALTVSAPPVAQPAEVPTDTSFRAKWSLVAGAISYRLDVATDSTFIVGSFVSGYNNRVVVGTDTVVRGLSAGATYYYRVRSVNASGTSANSNRRTAVTIPGAPVATAAGSITTSSFRANWNGVFGASYYLLSVLNEFNAPVTGYENREVFGTNETVSGLSGGTEYRYRVRAVNSAGTGSPSNLVTATTAIATVPTPTALAATSLTGSGFTANWSSVAQAVGYRIDVSADGFQTFVQPYQDRPVGGTNETVSGLADTTRYFYRVRAIDDVGGTSAYSNTISTHTLLMSPPMPTTAPASNIDTTEFTANWNRVRTAYEGYLLDVARSAGFTDTVFTNRTIGHRDSIGFFVSDLSQGSSYFYRVRSVNRIGISGYSDTAGTATRLRPPASVSARGILDTAFTAAWGVVPGSESYVIDVGLDSAFSSFVVRDSSVVSDSLRVTDLIPSTVYFYRVRAFSVASGLSAFSNIVSVTTGTASPPSPVPLSPPNGATDQDTAVIVAWDSAARALYYRLQVGTHPSFVDTLLDRDSILVPQFQLTGLSPGTRYYWRVNAWNDAGSSNFSETWNFLTAVLAPDPPQLLYPPNDTTNVPLTATLIWGESPNATSYDLQVATDSLFTGIFVSDSALTDGSKEITGMTNLTTYFWRVRATNGGVIGVYSSPSRFTTMQVPPPAPGLVSPPNSSVNLSANPTFVWNSVADTVSSDTTYYVLQIGREDTTLVFADSSLVDTTLQVTGVVENARRYFWRVAARNSAGLGAFSEVRSFTTILEPPLAVTLLSPQHDTTLSVDTVRFVWRRQDPFVEKYWLQFGIDSSFATSTNDSSITQPQTGDSTITRIATSLTTNQTYWWRVRAKNPIGWGPPSQKRSFRIVLTSVNDEFGPPTTFALLQNYPNPFNPTTTIRYDLPIRSRIRIEIFNAIGQIVMTLVNAEQDAGYYTVTWPPAGSLNYSSGLYYYRMEAVPEGGNGKPFVQVKKMIFVR
jgi:phosphodiesterase/alkaline phosphatase D-like protein